jgi:hypothetical protein
MIGSSGRQDDMATTNALRRFETVMDNIQTLWSVSLSQALKVCDTVPDMLPISVYAKDRAGDTRLLKEISIGKSDIKGYYDCEVKLKAAEAIQADREMMAARSAYQAGLYDFETTLIEGYGKTQEEAQRIMDAVAVDMVTYGNPLWLAMVGQQYAEERGIPVEALMQFASQMSPVSKGRQPEIKTQRGMEGIDRDFQRGVRMPPGAGV